MTRSDYSSLRQYSDTTRPCHDSTLTRRAWDSDSTLTHQKRLRNITAIVQTHFLHNAGW